MYSTLSTFNTTTEVPLSKATNPQLLPGRRSINGCPHCSGCVFTVCVCVCVHFGWANAEHEFWVWVTILGRMSLHFIYHTTVSSGPLIWLDMWCFQESPLFNFFLKLNTMSLTTHDATSNLAVHTKHDATPQRDRLNQISQPIKSVCGRALSRSALHSQQNV